MNLLFGRVAIVVLVLSNWVYGNIIHVPQDQPTIQAGIDTATNGDTVLVSPGIYVENINFLGTNIVVGSLFLMTGDTSYISQTVIDGDSSGSVVTFKSGEDSTAVMSGMTIRNGRAWISGDLFGGGIYCSDSSPIIVNSVIVNNSAFMGGGIYLSNSHMSIENCIIKDNIRNINSGGGIYCDSSQINLKNVSIQGNYAYVYGGGLYCINSSLTIENCMINDNGCGSMDLHYDYHGAGGGIFFKDSDVLVTGTIINGNTTFLKGGGIYLDHTSTTILNSYLSNNAAINSGHAFGGAIYSHMSTIMIDSSYFINNTSSDYGGAIDITHQNIIISNSSICGNYSTYGGGLFCSSTGVYLNNVTFSGNSSTEGGAIVSWYSDAILTNCILWDNSPEEIFYAYSGGPTNELTIAHSDIQGGEEGISTLYDVNINWEEGNIEADPLFVDPESSDFNLQEGSPCIDAGIDFFVWEEDTLVDLDPGEYQGNAPDMGAFESPYTASVTDQQQVPKKFALYQNFPNPFNPLTTVTYSLPERTHAGLKIYDLIGREIRTLVDTIEEPGHRSVTWDATDNSGKLASTGIYIYKLTTENYSQARKMVLLR